MTSFGWLGSAAKEFITELRTDASDFAAGKDVDATGAAGLPKSSPAAAPAPTAEPAVKPAALIAKPTESSSAVSGKPAEKKEQGSAVITANEDDDDVGWDDEEWGDLGATPPSVSSSAAVVGTEAPTAVCPGATPALHSTQASEESRETPTISAEATRVALDLETSASGGDGVVVQDRMSTIERELLEARAEIKRLNDAAMEQARTTQVRLASSESEIARCHEAMSSMQTQITELSTALIQVRTEIKQLAQSRPAAAANPAEASRIPDGL